MRYQGSSRIRGGAGGKAVPGSSPGSPHVLDRGDIAIGGGGSRGGGTCSPSPVSHAPTTLLLVAGISPRDTHALLPAAPTPPAPSPAGSPHTSAGTPAPPAPSALLPRPRWGRGPCVAISGKQPYPGWSRGKAVSGVELVGNRIRGGAGGKPYPALLQDLPMLWTVGISPLGEAARGAGELVPPPLSPTLQPSCFSPASLARAFADRLPIPFCRHPPPRPRLRQRISIHFCRPPTPPAPSPAGSPHTSAGSPYPTRAFGKGYSYPSAGTPTPPAPS